MQFPGSLIVYAVLVPLLAGVTVHTFTRKSKAQTDKTLGIMLSSLLIASVCIALTLLSSGEPWIYIFNEAKFIGLAFTPALLLLFYLEFMRIRLTIFEKAVLFSIPALTAFFALTNPAHHFFRTGYSLIYDGGFAYFRSENSVWMYVHIIYSYIVTLIGLFLLIRQALRRSAVYREQILLMTMGITLAFVTSIAVTFGSFPDYADVSVISLAFGAFTSYAGCMIYSPKNMLNMARDLAVNNLDAPFILFNDLYELVDFNACAAKLIGLTPDMKGDLKLGDFISDYLHLTDRDIDGKEAVLASENWDEVYCRVYTRYFNDKGGKPSGCVILLENVTQGKRMIKELNFTLHRDRLTGMPNFLALEHEFGELAKRGCQSIVLLRFNINGLKLVNSMFGNAHGDEVVNTVASFIMSACPDRRLCARVSGDEFAVLLTDCRETNAIELAVSVNVRLKNAKHLRLPVSVSYGATARMWDAEPLERMMRRADDDIIKQKLSFHENDQGATLEAIRSALDDAGIETLEHTERTRGLVVRLGATLGLELQTLNELCVLAAIHDIGMLVTPSGLLRKSEAYTSEEWETVKLHCAKGHKIALSSPLLAHAAKGILAHHERWDGAGYPNSLAGKNIPTVSRVMAIVDAYDRWAHGMNGSTQSAISRLEQEAGKRFDPELVEIFIKELAE